MKFDFKNILIFMLGVLLVISFFIGKKEGDVNGMIRIKDLQKDNKLLLDKNKELTKSIDSLNYKIDSTQLLLVANNEKVIELQTQIKKLKDEKNKIHYIVKYMSADVVANTFSNYLDKRN